MAVLSPGELPVNHGFGIIGAVSGRDHTSYVIRGRVLGGKETLYWPVASLLTSFDMLSDLEIEWCHNHAEAVRFLMIRDRIINATVYLDHADCLPSPQKPADAGV